MVGFIVRYVSATRMSNAAHGAARQAIAWVAS
jgi:hypothetical protein